MIFRGSVIFIETVLRYKTNTRSQMIGKQNYTIIDKTPVFPSDNERKAVIKSVENGLYNIFRKYMS